MISNLKIEETNVNYYTDLTDAEFKVYKYIIDYNMTNRKEGFYIPGYQHIAMKLDKGESTVRRILASLRDKKVKYLGV